MDTILVADDDVTLVNTLVSFLKTEDYQTLTAYTAEDAISLALSEAQPDLILLDVMIPSMGGIEACRQIRARSPIPVVFLTALGDVEHVVAGLEAGADDYLVKPYDGRELIARIRAHLRRREFRQVSERFIFHNGKLIVDLSKRQVLLDGAEVALTPREFALLAALVDNAGRVITTGDLLAAAWGEQFRQATDNIKPYIHYLRKKLGKTDSGGSWIVTARGVGYRFSDA